MDVISRGFSGYAALRDWASARMASSFTGSEIGLGIWASTASTAEPARAARTANAMRQPFHRFISRDKHSAATACKQKADAPIYRLTCFRP
jgi:hypothetical protein